MKFTTAALPIVAAARVLALTSPYESGEITLGIRCTWECHNAPKFRKQAHCNSIWDDDCVYKSPEFKGRVARCLKKNCPHDFHMGEPKKYGGYSNTIGPRGILDSGSHHSEDVEIEDIENPFILQGWGTMSNEKPPACAPFCLKALVHNLPLKFCQHDEQVGHCILPSELADLVSECCLELSGRASDAEAAAEWVVQGCSEYIAKYGSKVDPLEEADLTEHDECHDSNSKWHNEECDVFKSDHDEYAGDCTGDVGSDSDQVISECSEHGESENEDYSDAESENEESEHEESEHEGSDQEEYDHEESGHEDSDHEEESDHEESNREGSDHEEVYDHGEDSDECYGGEEEHVDNEHEYCDHSNSGEA